MSSAANPRPVAAAVADVPTSGSLRRPNWVYLAWFAGLLILAYGPVLARLVNQWNNDEDMGHGFFVPIIAGYIAWQKRDQLLNADLRPNYLGLVVVGFAAFQCLIGTLAAELFLARTAFIEAVIGSVLFLGGWTALRVLTFPLGLLFLMVPLPAVIYNQITLPLQLFASKVAATVLEFSGIPVLRDGNVLELPSQRLNVVEACSGIRSLLTLSFLSLVYAYFFDRRVWMRPFLLVCTVPIAIIANAGRVTMTGFLSEIDPELVHGTAHTASGWVVFMIALILLVLVHQTVNVITRRKEAAA
jgi:exosortase